MDNETLLIRAICTHPREDTPRLVYADWCEEHGRRWHAELIRLQCAKASPQKMAGFRRRVRKDVGPLWELRDALLINESFRWGIDNRDPLGQPATAPYGIAERGFTSVVACRLSELLEHLDDIFRRHPIRRVALMDRFSTRRYVSGDVNRPNDGLVDGYYRQGATDEFGMLPAAYNTLPSELFDRLPESDHPAKPVGAYTNGGVALAALNAACLRLGRERRAELWAG